MSDLIARFWAKVKKSETCWTWRGCLNSKGYGCLTIGGQRALAHRVAYADEFGLIPGDLTIDHLCRNKQCVRASHMEVVSRSENGKRGRADQLGKVAAA